MASNSLRSRDIAYHVHSQTDLSAHEKLGPTIMVSGEGATIRDEAGNSYIDAMAGLWCTALGYSEQRLIDAATRQMQRLPYFHNFAHRSTDVMIELAERLCGLAPVPMSKVLYQSSGSEANDTAIKLAWYYFNALGKPEKRKVLSRQRAYHGTSISSASLTGLPPLHREFNLPLPGMLHLTCPHYYREHQEGESEADFVDRLIQELEATIAAEGADTIAAFFVEPVMGTGGCVPPPPGYFERVQEVLRRNEILLVVDEVITGFGRTGQWWGSQTYNLKPDMLTCAKALTSAYFPLSALMISEPIYQAMRQQSEKLGVFGHGYTYGGHPVGCAVALEALRIYEEENLPARANALGQWLGEQLAPLTSHPLVGEVRGVGLMWAVELIDPATGKPFDVTQKTGLRLQQIAFENGLITRALGDSLVFAPPLVIAQEELGRAVEIFNRSLDQLGAALSATAA